MGDGIRESESYRLKTKHQRIKTLQLINRFYDAGKNPS